MDDSNAFAVVPQPQARPAMARWLWERKISFRKAGRAIGRSHEWMRRVCLPFDDPLRIEPDAESAILIERYTAGAITPPTFAAESATCGAS